MQISVFYNKVAFLGYLLLFASTAISAENQSQSRHSKPNIMLVLSDDHSYPHAGCYDDFNVGLYDITPNLDKFAEEGVRFTRAYTSAPQCAPSRISIFTGSNPVKLGVTRFAQPAIKEVSFFTDVLKKNGYWTALDGRHHHLDGRVRENEMIEEVLIEEGMKNLDLRFDHVASTNTKGDNLEKVPGLIDYILDQVPDEKPFFLYFGFNQPHRKFEIDHEEIDPDQLILPPDFPDLPAIRKDYARYLSEVRDMDRGFGFILNILEERKLAENTIVIFMGDNGEALLRGKGTLHGRGIHVPMIIRWPNNIKANSVCNTLVSGDDLAPTLLEMVGLSFSNKITGRSFLGALNKDKMYMGRKYVFAERGWHWGPLTRTDGLDFSRSVTSRRYHFIYNALPLQEFAQVDMVKTEAWDELEQANKAHMLSKLHQNLYFQGTRPVFELYDLQNDPFELNNLAGTAELEETEKKLRNEMEKWMVKNHDFLPLPSHIIINIEKRNQ